MKQILKPIAMTLLLMLGTGTAIAQTDFRSLSFEEALQAAKKEKKMVFIDFYTDWCGPCKNMAKNVFPQPKVGAFMNPRFVCLKLNAEKEGKELARTFKVSAYPTYVVTDATGAKKMTAKGSMDADEFIAKIEEGIDPEKSPERMMAQYKEGKRTPELVNRYALYLMQEKRETEGFQVVDDYFASLSEKDRLSAANSFLYTRYTLKLNDAKAQFMIAHIQDFAAEVKEAVSKRMQQLFHSAVVSYYSGYLLRNNKYVEAEYLALKKQIQDLRLDKQYAYAPMFQLIESRVKDDDATFLTRCAEQYDQLALADQRLLILNFTRLIDTQDKEILQRMSTFVRSHLATMDANTITLAGRMLGGIEK